MKIIYQVVSDIWQGGGVLSCHRTIRAAERSIKRQDAAVKYLNRHGGKAYHDCRIVEIQVPQKKKMAVIDMLRVEYMPGTLLTVRAAIKAADEGGTIDAKAMMKLSSDPRKHTSTSLSNFLRSIGAAIIDVR